VLTRVLSDRQDALLREERGLLMRLRTALARTDASGEQQDALDQSISQLDELFLLVVVGEFNAGKSAFINALIGQPLMEEGVTPTTAVITVLEHGNHDERIVRQANLLAIKAPVDLLRDIRIVDTPGTNAIIREHEIMTAEFVPRSDLVFFVTSADRPFTESERSFMQRIRSWGKKIVVIVNKSDILENAAQVSEIRSFVADNARSLLGVEPDIFFVSAKLALRAKLGDPSVWDASGFEALEAYVSTTLNGQGRARLKMLNPVGVAAAVAERQRTSLRDRQALLKDDVATLEQVERQLALYQKDMERDFELRMADVENVLLEMEHRGHQFFDDTMRIGRVMDLMNRSLRHVSDRRQRRASGRQHRHPRAARAALRALDVSRRYPGSGEGLGLALPPMATPKRMATSRRVLHRRVRNQPHKKRVGNLRPSRTRTSQMVVSGKQEPEAQAKGRTHAESPC
jgi:small GTP-binding protein